MCSRFYQGLNGTRISHTWRKFRMAPLILRESAAIPAMPPDSWSLSCLREVDGWAAPTWRTQLAPQQGAADASGWELCRIILDPGKVVTIAAGATGHELHDTWNVTDNCGQQFASLTTPLKILALWNYLSSVERVFLQTKFYSPWFFVLSPTVNSIKTIIRDKKRFLLGFEAL